MKSETAGHYVSDHRSQGRQTGQFTAASILRETIAVTKTTHKDLHERHGMYLAEIEMTLRGGRISRGMAQKLENAFGSPALFWV